MIGQYSQIKWRQCAAFVLSFVSFRKVLVSNQRSNPKVYWLRPVLAQFMSNEYSSVLIARAGCVFGVFFHTRQEDGFGQETLEGRQPSLDPTLENAAAFDAGNDAKILGNAAVSKFTFCIQGLALSPYFCSFLRGLKAVDASLSESSEIAKQTICRAVLLSDRLVRLHM